MSPSRWRKIGFVQSGQIATFWNEFSFRIYLSIYLKIFVSFTSVSVVITSVLPRGRFLIAQGPVSCMDMLTDYLDFRSECSSFRGLTMNVEGLFSFESV